MKLALVRDAQGRRAAGLVDTEAQTWTAIRGAEDLGEAGLLEILPLADVELGDPTPLAEVKLIAPIPHPRRNLFCVGKNYYEHAAEFSRSGYDAGSTADESTPALPIFFTKPATTIIGPDDTIDPHRDLTHELDYEAEIAVVLSKGGRNISPEDAMDHVGWYTAANDVTARDLQRDHKQWFIGKSLDTFCPMGPWLLSRDELAVEEISVSCYVEEELRQQAKLTELIFDIPTLISTLSAGITLEAGDIILTGTPAGVGIGRTPAQFLSPGETVRVEVTGLGTLSNIVGA